MTRLPLAANLLRLSVVFSEMRLEQLQHDQQYCLRVAAEALGGLVRPVVLDDEIEIALCKRLRRLGRRGLDGGQPVIRFVDERRGQQLELGLEVFDCDLENESIRLVRIAAPHMCFAADACYEFWGVPEHHYQAFYRFVRRLMHRRQRHVPPVLRPHQLDELWKNTIGFLRHGRELLKRYGVPQKRGVLLLGEPGNGKTMACRWLRAQCNQHQLHWGTVTAEQFESARAEGKAHRLFHIRRPGILLFDDIDLGVQQAREPGHIGNQSTLLCGLDGLECRRGVVYLFTSNVRIDDLDPAFRRPGRIDVIMHFSRPDAALRRQFISEHWHDDLLKHLDVARAVSDTDGLSFAEIDELKRLLVFGFLNNGRWDWTQAYEAFRSGRSDIKGRRIGFAARGHCQKRTERHTS